MKRAGWLLVCWLCSTVAVAQFGTPYCQDTLAINPSLNCPPDFQPVCACDDSTYRNICHAQRNGIILWEGGTCEPFAMNFYPNPVADFMRLTLYLKVQGDADLYIFDQYGQVRYHQFFYNIQRQELFFEIANWEQGLYVLAMRFQDQWVLEKMIKMKTF